MIILILKSIHLTLVVPIRLHHRPIYHLPILSKGLERIICKLITEYLVTNNLYYPIETALKMVTDFILKLLDDNN